MLKDYLNQTAIWESVTGVDDYNQPTYSTNIISCRKEEGFKLIRNKEGSQVVSSAVYFTLSAIKVDDLLDGRAVLASKAMINFEGVPEGYGVYVT